MYITPASTRSQSDKEHRHQRDVFQRALRDMLKWRFGEVVQYYPQTQFGIETLRHRALIAEKLEKVPDLFAVVNSRAGLNGTEDCRAIATDCRDSQGRPLLKQMYQDIGHYRNSGRD